MPSDEKADATSLIRRSSQELSSTRVSLVKRGLQDISEGHSVGKLPQVPGGWPELLEPEEPWPDAGSNHLRGGPTDWDDARQLAAQGEWLRAFETVEKILDLPAELQAAKNRLLAILEDKSKVRMEYKMLGRDVSGQYQAKSRARLGGAVAAPIMAFRAQCITGMIIDLITAARKSSRSVTSDSAFANLYAKASDHINLVCEVFGKDPENLFRAATLSYASAQLQPSTEAIQLVHQALAIEPDNELARGFLALLEKRIAELHSRR